MSSVKTLLSQIPVGKSGTVVSVNGERSQRCRLMEMGILPGTLVSVKRLAPMGDPIEIRLRGYALSIRVADADGIEVTETTN